MAKQGLLGRKNRFLGVILLAITLPAIAQHVRISSIVPLDPSDTNYSNRYRQAYSNALFFAAGEQNQKLQQCGYELAFDFTLYPENDRLRAKEIASELEKKGSWVVIGPSRSDHFLIMTKGISDTVAVSPMASAKSVHDLPKPFFTLYPSNFELATALASLGSSIGSKYGIVLNKQCLSCRNFSDSYQKIIGKPEFIVDATSPNPDLGELLSSLKKHQIDYLLSPNFSKLSGRIIAEISRKRPDLPVLGGDGWGDGMFGFVSKYPINEKQRGYSVRLGGPPDVLAQSLSLKSLSFYWQDQVVHPPISVVNSVEMIRGLANFICRYRPSDKKQFTSLVKEKSNELLQSRVKIGLYELQGPNLKFKSYWE